MRQLALILSVLAASLLATSSANAQNYWPRHYPPFDPVDPRPDILPRTFYNNWVSYREANNRPTYVGGLIAHTIEPISQEAMSWEENVNRGYYKTHCPTPVRMYLYPKPWEVIETGVRPAADNSQDEFDRSLPPVNLTPNNPSPAIQRY